MTALTYQQELRYNRQIMLNAVDFDGQEKLCASAMLIVGLGGLGCAAAQYLTAAGIGKLYLIDFDHVTLSNLQRQVLHNDARLNLPKVESAKIALQQLNPTIQIEAINAAIDIDKLQQILPQVAAVIDCSDNLECRNLLDIACEQASVPLISGAAIRFEGQVSVFDYRPTANGQSPRYRDLSQLIGDGSLSCVEAGVISPIVGIVGSIQALEAIKICLNIGETLQGRLLLIDGLTMKIRELQLPSRKEI